MRLVGTALVATLVVLAGCGAGVPESMPEEVTAESPEPTVSTETPTPTRTTVCREPTPVPDPESIDHSLAVSNEGDQPITVTVSIEGEGLSETQTRALGPRERWVPLTITNPGTYRFQIETEDNRTVTTLDPPYSEYPTRYGSTTWVRIEASGTITIRKGLVSSGAPTPVCTR